MFNNGTSINDSWIWIILIFALLFGGGFGGNGNYNLASDFATLQRQIDTTSTATQSAIYQNADQLQRQVTQVANGIASLGYDQLNQTNQIGRAISDCCCSTKSAIADTNYNIVTQSNGIVNAVNSGFCQSNYNNASNTRDIVDSQNLNTRAILDKLCSMENNAQQDKIATLQAENQRLAFAQSQQNQNAYLISRLQPTPVPSYPASNLYGYYGTTIG